MDISKDIGLGLWNLWQYKISTAMSVSYTLANGFSKFISPGLPLPYFELKFLQVRQCFISAPLISHHNSESNKEVLEKGQFLTCIF